MPFVFLLIGCVVMLSTVRPGSWHLLSTELKAKVNSFCVQNSWMCGTDQSWLHHYCTDIVKIFRRMKDGRRSHVPFLLYFKRHVKYAGHARLTYTLGVLLSSWGWNRALKAREGSGIEECGGAIQWLGPSVYFTLCETGSVHLAAPLT